MTTWTKIGRWIAYAIVFIGVVVAPILQLTLYSIYHYKHPDEPHDRLVENILGIAHWIAGLFT